MYASSMSWVLSQVDRKCRRLCGLIEAVIPALALYRARSFRTPRSL